MEVTDLFSLTKHLVSEEIVTRNAPAPVQFRLLRYFTLISLISIVVTSLVLGALFRHIAVENLLSSEERHNVALARLLANAIWPRYSDYIESAADLPVTAIRKHQSNKALDKSVERQTRGLSILKVKIYDLNGFTAYSTDTSQLGKSKKDSPAFQFALNRGVTSKLSFRDKIYARKELIENRNVLASYVPIQRHQGAEVEGVFEIYKDVTPLLNGVSVMQRQVVSGVTATLFGLFLILFLVVKRADGIISRFSDAQRANAEKMRYHAFHDDLTGLPNRFLFIDRLEHALANADREDRLVGLMFIDLDKFKQINDSLGHEKGDQLLFQVAQRLRDGIRPGDTVARIAGDEFTLLMEGLKTIDLIISVAQRIVTVFAKPFELDHHEVIMTCSIGIAIYPFQDDNAQTLVKKADDAMYFAKQRGRNNYYLYSPEMNKQEKVKHSLENDIYQALENDEFRIYFQPKVNTSNWRMQGMEALLHWKHPTEGLILPDRFLPLLEETGLITKVGTWVLRQSCMLNKQWQDEGLEMMKVAVNVSLMQFRQYDFVSVVKNCLEESGLDPAWLELELSERCVSDDIENSEECLHELRELGVTITMDDFCTGYSSLRYLCKLPIDTIKIDQVFVKDMIEKRQSKGIVTALISLAHSLRLNIVADGVETIQQLTFLNAMRCNVIQGVLLSNPLAEEDFVQLYRNGAKFDHLMKEFRNNITSSNS